MRKWRLRPCGETTVTELWKDAVGVLVERDHDKCRYFISNETLAKMYVEYKEPRKIEEWMNVYEGPNGLKFGQVSWPSKDEAIKCGRQRDDYISTVKVTWTEGE